MAQPLNTRGAKSRANLRRGGTAVRAKRPNEAEVKRISRRLLLSKKYQTTLKKRLEEGSCQPGVEAMLWYYAFNKPTEHVENKQVTPVRIVNEFAKE